MLGDGGVCWDFISASGTELPNGAGATGRRAWKKPMQSASHCIAGVDIALRRLEYIFLRVGSIVSEV